MRGIVATFASALDGWVIDPDTGEMTVIEDATPEALAHALDQVTGTIDIARSARHRIEDELRARLGPARELAAGDWTVRVRYRRDWDTHATWEALSSLVDRGLLDPRDVDRAMPERTQRVTDGRHLNAILAHLAGVDPEAAGPLARARRETARVTVTGGTQ